jgi:hypothetical protein
MKCYVFHSKRPGELPLDILNMGNTLFYPEKTMSVMQQCTSGVPRGFHIVTDSPFLVGLYSREDVYMWSEEYQRWVHPNVQTYGANFEVILSHVFGYTNGIAGAVISNKYVTNVMGHPLKK